MSRTGYTLDMQENIVAIYGTHAVTEALTMRPDVVRALHSVGPITDPVLLQSIKTSHIPLRECNPKKLPKGVPSDAVHQGIIAEIDTEKLVVAYEDFVRTLAVTGDTSLVLLGEVQDPHNVGAVIRSAAAFGVSGVLIPEHRQAQVNGTVIKVSAGMAFQVPLISLTNVNHVVADLKHRGFWVYGLAGDAAQSVADEQFEKPTVLILGNEGTGIRKKTLEHCDIPLRIPMSEKAESLNASVAAGIVLYAWSVHHPRALNEKTNRQ